MIQPCKVCGASQWAVAHEGLVRHGVVGQSVPGVVYRCGQCGVEFLPPLMGDLSAYYESGAYREDVGEAPDVASYFKLHDAEQFRKYPFLEKIPIRGQVVADIGCAGGSFLDGMRGFASVTIGVEPALAYHASIRKRGHRVYPSIDQALAEWRDRVDLVTSFSVVEHVQEPVGFLSNIRALLAGGGCLLISTPNRRDILLELESGAYRSFFYRTAHVYYFDEDSLRYAAQAAGFTSFEVKYVHRFNFANFTSWLQQGRPTGNTKQSILGWCFDSLWRTVLEERKMADYLYAFLRV